MLSRILPLLSPLFLAPALLAGAPAQAQTPAPTPVPAPTSAAAPVTHPVVEGKTVDGKPFSLSSQRGKVVLLMFWSTGCAVCRDKMPELRQNYQGWAGKPFELVLVSTDRRVQDLYAYEQIISRTVPLKQRFVQLWAGEAGYRDNLGAPGQLPATLLIDKTGKVVARYAGRMPAEAWDQVAELL
ncbi:MAG: TlpA family protein disulfide reductase [Ramlibacter sp.]|nr:TlpA family protein disulfide reductase [Ramlibacter sp.]